MIYNFNFIVKDKNKYEVSTNQWKTPDDLVNIYGDLLQAHPSIAGLIDPFHSKVIYNTLDCNCLRPGN